MDSVLDDQIELWRTLIVTNKVYEYIRDGWRRCETTLETSGEDVKTTLEMSGED